jgi:ribosome biogenesis GTPase A
MEIQWYPGHMAKTIRLLREDIKLVDLVIELADARAPLSTRNPEITKIAGNKRRVLVLNKADLADDSITRDWITEYKKTVSDIFAINALTSNGPKTLLLKLKQYADENNQTKPYKKVYKVMVVGIPNVGKSSLINQLTRCSNAKTADRPGVTRGRQWIALGKWIRLLDTPGILWPKFEDPEIGIRLALIRSIKEELLDPVTLSLKFSDFLKINYPDALLNRYKLKSIPNDPEEIIMAVGQSRGCLLPEGKIDIERAANIIIDDFRHGYLGKISLEKP